MILFHQAESYAEDDTYCRVLSQNIHKPESVDRLSRWTNNLFTCSAMDRLSKIVTLRAFSNRTWETFGKGDGITSLLSWKIISSTCWCN